MKKNPFVYMLVALFVLAAGCGDVYCWSCLRDGAVVSPADAAAVEAAVVVDATPSGDAVVADAASTDTTPSTDGANADVTPAQDSSIPSVCTPGQVDWDCVPIPSCGTHASSRVCSPSGSWSLCVLDPRCFSGDAGAPAGDAAADAAAATDAATVADSGSPAADAGTPARDSGTPATDSGSVTPPPATDAGVGRMLEVFAIVDPSSMYPWGVATGYEVHDVGWGAVICVNTGTTSMQVMPDGRRRCTFSERLVTDHDTGTPVFVVRFRSPYHPGELGSVWYTGGACQNTGGVTVTASAMGVRTLSLTPYQVPTSTFCRHTYVP